MLRARVAPVQIRSRDYARPQRQHKHAELTAVQQKVSTEVNDTVVPLVPAHLR